MHLWEYKYLKGTVDDSVIICDKKIDVTDSVSKNVTNTIPTSMENTILTNVTSTAPINFDDKKVRYKMVCYILNTFLLVNILLNILCNSEHINEHIM